MSAITINLLKEASGEEYHTDSQINDAMVRFRLFLEELGIPITCFSSSALKHIWYFSREGKRLFIDFHNKRNIKPYADIRKGVFSLEYREAYMWIINCACANLESARKYAKKGQLEKYPIVDDVRNHFWANIIIHTDCSVVPGINYLLSATSDIDYIHTIKRMPVPDLVYIGDIICAEFSAWTQKWESIIKEMRILRRKDLAPDNRRSPRQIYELMNWLLEKENKLPSEPCYTSGRSSENATKRQQERHEYEQKWLEAMIFICEFDDMLASLEYSDPPKTSAEIYNEALSNVIDQSTDS